MNSPNIVYLVEHWLEPGFPGSTGGTAYNYALVSALAQRWGVTVIALRAPTDLVPAGVRLVRFKQSAKMLPKSRMLFWKRDLRQALGGLPKPRLLLTTSATNAIASESNWAHKVAAVVQAYEDFGIHIPDSTIASRLHNLKRLLATGQISKPGFLGADAVLTNSDFLKTCLLDKFSLSQPCTVLYPPQMLPVVSIPNFSNEAKKSVGFVNRNGKNLEFVLDLARAVPQRDFLIFGHPINDIVGLPKNVIVRGWASDRLAMYASADTWIMPSKWQEPFGMVATEALARGCRVGVSNHGGLPEAVDTAGTVFDSFDVAQWSDWLRKSTKPDDNLRALHVSKFGWDRFRMHACDWAEGLMS